MRRQVNGVKTMRAARISTPLSASRSNRSAPTAAVRQKKNRPDSAAWQKRETDEVKIVRGRRPRMETTPEEVIELHLTYRCREPKFSTIQRKMSGIRAICLKMNLRHLHSNRVLNHRNEQNLLPSSESWINYSTLQDVFRHI